MNPLMLVNWRSVSEGFTFLCWVAAVVATCWFLANLTATPDVTPKRAHTVVVGR